MDIGNNVAENMELILQNQTDSLNKKNLRRSKQRVIDEVLEGEKRAKYESKEKIKNGSIIIKGSKHPWSMEKKEL